MMALTVYDVNHIAVPFGFNLSLTIVSFLSAVTGDSTTFQPATL